MSLTTFFTKKTQTAYPLSMQAVFMALSLLWGSQSLDAQCSSCPAGATSLTTSQTYTFAAFGPSSLCVSGSGVVVTLNPSFIPQNFALYVCNGATVNFPTSAVNLTSIYIEADGAGSTVNCNIASANYVIVVAKNGGSIDRKALGGQCFRAFVAPNSNFTMNITGAGTCNQWSVYNQGTASVTSTGSFGGDNINFFSSNTNWTLCATNINATVGVTRNSKATMCGTGTISATNNNVITSYPFSDCGVTAAAAAISLFTPTATETNCTDGIDNDYDGLVDSADPDCTPAGAISTIDCAGAVANGTLTASTAASGVSSVISYTGGNGGTHTGQTVTSTGVTGLTATLTSGSFASGNGTLTYTITGTPSGAGTASFAINIGGKTCTLTRTVSAAAGTISTIDCAGAVANGTLTASTAASGVSSVISYTGGNGGTHTGQTVTSTGVTGLTATLASGSFASGNGTLTYTITGTPSGAGTASFAINIGGQTCTLTRTVSAAPVALTLQTPAAQTATTGQSKSGNAATELAPAGGTSPYTYSINSTCTPPSGGSVLTGVTVNSSTGAYTYTAPTTAGTYVFCIQVCDSATPTADCKTATYTVTVTAACSVSSVVPGVK